MDIAQQPYLVVALLCDTVERDADGALSFIGIHDQYGLKASELGDASAQLRSFAIISLRSDYPGHAGKKFNLALRTYFPSGELTREYQSEVELNGPALELLAIRTVGIPVRGPGVHWLEILLDGRALARLPIAISLLPPSESPLS